MFDCIIIGCGPAGMTAGIYLKRNNLNILVIDKNVPGGTMVSTAVINNYPGFESIDGASLASNMYLQLNSLGVRCRKEEAIKITKENKNFIVETNKNKYETKKIILGLGLIHRRLYFSNEEDFINKGISWCAICDGSLYKDKDVCVVGGGNSALEESIYLSSICKSVSIIHRRDTFRADKKLIEETQKRENIHFYLNETIERIIGKDQFEGILLTSGKEIKCAALFEFVGFIPSTDFLRNLNILDEYGFVKVDSKFETSEKGIYAIGDCINKSIRQIATAVGDGAFVGSTISKSIED